MYRPNVNCIDIVDGLKKIRLWIEAPSIVYQLRSQFIRKMTMIMGHLANITVRPLNMSNNFPKKKLPQDYERELLRLIILAEIRFYVLALSSV